LRSRPVLESPHAKAPPVALGLASLVLGTVGNVLCFLPILGIPLGVCGVLLGLAGWFAARLGEASRRRWALVGAVVSGVALLNGFALAYAPLGYEPGNAVPPGWQTPPEHPFVPPPALPGRVWRAASQPG